MEPGRAWQLKQGPPAGNDPPQVAGVVPRGRGRLTQQELDQLDLPSHGRSPGSIPRPTSASNTAASATYQGFSTIPIPGLKRRNQIDKKANQMDVSNGRSPGTICCPTCGSKIAVTITANKAPDTDEEDCKFTIPGLGRGRRPKPNN